jgi:hypothetical protein
MELLELLEQQTPAVAVVAEEEVGLLQAEQVDPV